MTKELLITGLISATLGVGVLIGYNLKEQERKTEVVEIQGGKQCISDAIRFGEMIGEKVHYFIPASKSGACAMCGPCDFNGDGWYSWKEMEAIEHPNQCDKKCIGDLVKDEPFN